MGPVAMRRKNARATQLPVTHLILGDAAPLIQC
jgi:hypothetical protein